MLEPGPRSAWVGVIAAVVIFVGTAIALLLVFDGGPTPPFIAGTPTAAPLERRGDALRLAGSGSNIPVTRALAAAYAEAGHARPVVHPSIGSGGGVRALLDGAIDVALVSRPLKPDEQARGLVAHPYAEVPVEVAVHPNVVDQAISSEALLAIFRGEHRHWSDGSRIVVLQREPGDSSHRIVEAALPEFGSINKAAYQQNRWRVLYHDAAMREALESTEGAVGLYGCGDAPGDVSHRVLAIDGVEPSSETIRSRRYPFIKTLAFVTLGAPKGQAAAFIDFVSRDAGLEVIERHGGVVPGGTR